MLRCVPRNEQLGHQPSIGFSDAYPLHLLNLASARDVAEKVREDALQFQLSSVPIEHPPDSLTMKATGSLFE